MKMKDKRVKVSHKQLIDEDRRDKRKEKESDEPTCRCHQNPFIGARSECNVQQVNRFSSYLFSIFLYLFSFRYAF